MNNTDYSVLMSVYYKENPLFLRESIESILNQTIKTDDFVIVIDGPIPEELSKVIDEFKGLNPDIINVIAFPVNRGLGLALRDGLIRCRHNIVVRQDSDDISLPDRVEKQLKLMEEAGADIVSGTITEFIDSTDNITGVRKLPLTHDEIIKFSKKRNPFNHPSVIFSKECVIAAGNYDEEYHFFEDYALWARLLMNGARCANLEDTVVYMRVDANTFMRRGGKKYASDMLRFHKWLRKQKWSSTMDYLTGAVPHYIVCIMPSFLRQKIYKILH